MGGWVEISRGTRRTRGTRGICWRWEESDSSTRDQNARDDDDEEISKKCWMLLHFALFTLFHYAMRALPPVRRPHRLDLLPSSAYAKNRYTVPHSALSVVRERKE